MTQKRNNTFATLQNVFKIRNGTIEEHILQFEDSKRIIFLILCVIWITFRVSYS